VFCANRSVQFETNTDKGSDVLVLREDRKGRPIWIVRQKRPMLFEIIRIIN